MRWETPGDVNIKLMPDDAGSRAQAANAASEFGSCLGFFFRGEEDGKKEK